MYCSYLGRTYHNAQHKRYLHTTVWHTQGLLSPFLRPRPIHACAHGRYPTRARVSSDASCLWARQTACKFAHELQLVLRRGCGLSFAEQYGMRAGHTTHTPAISHRQSETPSANSRARAMYSYSMCVMSRAASPPSPSLPLLPLSCNSEGEEDAVNMASSSNERFLTVGRERP